MHFFMIASYDIDMKCPPRERKGLFPYIDYQPASGVL
jgi:hypothetical protein